MVEYKPEAERKTRTVSVRMTAADYDWIKSAADHMGTTVSRFMTMAANDKAKFYFDALCQVLESGATANDTNEAGETIHESR